MNIGSMFQDIFRSLFKKPSTELYPFQRVEPTTKIRGKLHYDPSKCTGCQLCVKDCPADALELIVVDRVAKKFVMKYHADRCIFCDQCVASCRFDCLGLSQEDWELASLESEPFTVYYGKEEDVRILLEKMAQPNSGEGCGESQPENA